MGGFRIYGCSDDLLHIMGDGSGVAAIEDATVSDGGLFEAREGVLAASDARRHAETGELSVELSLPFDGPYPAVELRRGDGSGWVITPSYVGQWLFTASLIEEDGGPGNREHYAGTFPLTIRGPEAREDTGEPHYSTVVVVEADEGNPITIRLVPTGE